MSPNGRKKQKADHKSARETIHSGHFMVSDIDDSEVQDGDESPSLVVHESDCEQESSPIPARGFDFESACKETSKTYVFGPRSSLSISIDASLTKLFECMTLAYSGKLTSPRWKQFKGLKLRLKEKIRLNNMIWRAWHMQFVMKLKTFVCQFATPLDGDVHTKPEAVVIEGTYWKRKMTNITAEYKKWRLFYKDRFQMKPISDNESFMDFDSRWSQRSVDSFPGCIDEDFIMDFTDTLFSTFNPSQPFDFPNPREIAARAGIADFIQPGLVQLQPCVDDFMDTFEPLQDFLNSKLPPLPEETTDSCGPLSNLTSVANPEVILFGATPQTGSLFSQSSTPFTSDSRKRNNDLKRKTFPHLKTQGAQLVPTGKMLLNTFLNTSADNGLLSEERGLSNPLQDVTMPCNMAFDSLSPKSAESPVVQPCTNLTQNSLMSSDFIHTSGGLLGNEPCSQKPEARGAQVFQQPARRSGILHPGTLNLSSKPTVFQTTMPIQVPLPPLLDSSPLTQNSTQIKSPNVAPFLNFDLQSVVQDQGLKFNNIGNMVTLDSQFPVQNIFSLQLIQPAKKEVELPECQKSTAKGKSADSQLFRRHSYATGQQVQNSTAPSTMEANRRSRRIAPATPPAVVNFVVPEIPSRHRIRSRSVSSPQGGSPKPFVQQSSQAVSLTDISVTLASQLSARRERSLLPDTSAFSRDHNLSDSVVLAQLLSSSRGACDLNNQAVKSPKTSQTSSPVTIIESMPSLVTTAAQAFVIAPLNTVSGVSDFQKNLLVGAANQVFGRHINSCTVPSPLPNSSDSSATSPLMTAGTSFDTSAVKTVRLKSDEERTQYKEHRRVCHINAEQKRRCNIKNGFEALHHLLPPLSQSPNAKVSKAALLQKGAEYIRLLKTERQQQQEEAELLKKQIEELNQAISHYQSQLPASGVPVPCQKTNRMREMFEEYVRQQTLKNWKFWIFSLILEPLVESYNSNVSTANVDEMCKSILSWLDQHCSLVALRPGVLNSLRHLSTTTNILADPSCMPEEATRAVTKKEPRQH